MKNWLIIVKNNGYYTEDDPLDVFKFSGSETKVKEEMLNLAMKYLYEAPLHPDEEQKCKVKKEGNRLSLYVNIEATTYKIEAIPSSCIPQSNALEFMEKNPKLKELTREELSEYLVALRYYDIHGEEKPNIKNVFTNVDEYLKTTRSASEEDLDAFGYYVFRTGRVLEFS